MADTAANAGFFDYWIKDSNGYMRAGTVMVVWNETTDTVEYTDTSTKDLGGSTAALTFTAAISSNDVQLTAVIASGTWTVAIGARLITYI